jgi:hypothetical protein
MEKNLFLKLQQTKQDNSNSVDNYIKNMLEDYIVNNPISEDVDKDKLIELFTSAANHVFKDIEKRVSTQTNILVEQIFADN